MIDVQTSVCNTILKSVDWPTEWTKCLIIALSKKCNLQMYQNYRTISLNRQPCEVILKVILKQTPATSGKDHCRRASWLKSRMEQIFNANPK